MRFISRAPQGMRGWNSWVRGSIYRTILSANQMFALTRDVLPHFAKNSVIDYGELHDLMVAFGMRNGIEFEPSQAIEFWVQQEQLLEVSSDHKQFRFTPKGIEIVEKWEDDMRLWNSGSNKPMPLVKRLDASEPARNIRKIKDIIGTSTVTAIHDPYTRAASLETIVTLADLETKFSRSLRILGAPLTKVTEKGSLINFLKHINTERNSRWEIRAYMAASKPHRRFLVLEDGGIVTCGMSLNRIDKDEVLDREQGGSEYAKHDCEFFEDNWRKGTPL